MDNEILVPTIYIEPPTDDAELPNIFIEPPPAETEDVEDRSSPRLWSPVCLSSPSASTEYWSDQPSPYHQHAVIPDDDIVLLFPGNPSSPLFHDEDADLSDLDAPIISADSVMRRLGGEQMNWFEPCPVEGYTYPNPGSEDHVAIKDDFGDVDCTPDTPEECVGSVPQAEVDSTMTEMTCGPKLEELFWPIRHQIRSGKLRLYENITSALIVQARRESQPTILSKLAQESASQAADISSSGLTSFLYQSSGRYERLRQVASEIQGLDLQRFKEATWEDRLTIIVIFYELLTSKRDLEELLELRGTRAQFMLDLMQDAIRTHPDFVHVLRGGTPRIRGARRNFLNGMKELGLLRNIDRASAHLDARRLIVQLSEVSDLLPSVLGIHGVDNVKPTALGGAFGDIYTADYQGQHVALKRLRFFQAEGDESHKIRQKFRREALIWKNLEHDYVLPFLGVDSETFPEFLCMVSPWMERGSLTSRSGIPGEGAIPTLMYEIAAGVQYLHSQNIVHGDLRGANILLDDQGHARLADFGLAVFADDPLAPTKRGGSLRWMAPELIHPQSCRLDIFQRTFASDMYAFGCVCLELYSGRPPFYDVASDGELLLKVIKGDRPEFPTTAPMWCAQMAAKCWAHHPLDRPGIGTIIEFIVNAARKRRRLEPEPTASESPHKKFKPNHSRRSSEGNSATFFHSRSSSSGSAYLSGDPAVYFKQRRDSESKRLSSHSNTYSE